MKRSAGILLYRVVGGKLLVLLAHPGGPLWAQKDAGTWTIPKGEFHDEDALTAAKREFAEETGSEVQGEFRPLTPIRQKGGKVVHAFACQGEFDPNTLVSNTFEMEWPPRSGKRGSFPEIDRVEWMAVDRALEKIHPAQRELITELARLLATSVS